MLFGRLKYSLCWYFLPRLSGVNNGATRENIDSFYPGRTNARNCSIWLLNSKRWGSGADVVNLHRAEERRDSYDRVVIGASIRYCGHYHSAFQEFVMKYATRLNGNVGFSFCPPVAR